MAQLELAETVEALRAELARAAAAGADAGFQFPVAGVQLEFHVAVTKTGDTALPRPINPNDRPLVV